VRQVLKEIGAVCEDMEGYLLEAIKPWNAEIRMLYDFVGKIEILLQQRKGK
jgi:hypothetical protein